MTFTLAETFDVFASPKRLAQWSLSFAGPVDYTLACDHLEAGEVRRLSTATHRVALFDHGGKVVRRYDIPAGSDACAIARAGNVVDMLSSGLLAPDHAELSRSERSKMHGLWISVLMLPPGEVAFPPLSR